MTIMNIHERIKNYYNQLEKITTEKPLATVIYSTIIKTIAISLCCFPNLLGLCVFMISLAFDIAIIKNFSAINNKIKETFNDIIGSISSTRRSASNTGSSVGGFESLLPAARIMER